MFLLTPAFGVSLWPRIVLWTIGGVIFGAALAVSRRRVFEKAGIPLDRSERQRAVEVLRRRELVDDLNLREVATNMARVRLLPANNEILVGTVFGVVGLLLLGSVSVSTGPPRFWILGVLLLIEGPWILWRGRRMRAEARAYLAVVTP